MAHEIVMPALEMAQDCGVLLRWLKSEGEHVVRGDPLMEIETSKAVSAIESPATGILAQVSAQPGDEVPVGRVIALLLEPHELLNNGGSSPAPHSQRTEQAALSRLHVPAARESSSAPNVVPEPVASPGVSSPKLRQLASPRARKMALTNGIDLAEVTGTGPNGACLVRDIASYAARNSAPEAALYRVVALKGMRRTIAERLSESARNVPHIHLSLSVDAGPCERVVKASRQVPSGSRSSLSITALICRAVATTLIDHRRLNAHLVCDEIREFRPVHLGVAVALEDGLIVPVVRHAESKSAAAVHAEFRDLVERARGPGLPLHAISGSTFTISNLGMYGIDDFSSIVNPPEVGILSVGAIHDAARSVDGAWISGRSMRLTLNVDHRAVDGAVAAQFLRALKGALESPEQILTA